jgi:type II secretory pathway pseudopilin PulG
VSHKLQDSRFKDARSRGLPCNLRLVSCSSRGFTYLGLLFAIAIMGAVLAATGIVWHTAQQREKERELLFVGNQFRHAIQLYYERSPAGAPQYPKSLEDLLKDKRYVTVERYLRKIYRDPMTGSTEWGLVTMPDGSIMGVYSLSDETPIKQGGFSEKDAAFEGRGSYREWQFVFVPAAVKPLVQ